MNYDHFGIVPELLDKYSAMVKRTAAAFYSRVTHTEPPASWKSGCKGLRPACQHRF
ncbi:MAG: hypothetical protein IPF39_16305 [Comamonadaceae bacterium]|uniref:hypothetical protein n=1 Tax=Candidatus Skiveiella danica TaxID=3386177 RepID=UPI00390BD373|nr:hypothetical protein [Comamonadaceae bacterium]